MIAVFAGIPRGRIAIHYYYPAWQWSSLPSEVCFSFVFVLSWLSTRRVGTTTLFDNGRPPSHIVVFFWIGRVHLVSPRPLSTAALSTFGQMRLRTIVGGVVFFRYREYADLIRHKFSGYKLRILLQELLLCRVMWITSPHATLRNLLACFTICFGNFFKIQWIEDTFWLDVVYTDSFWIWDDGDRVTVLLLHFASSICSISLCSQPGRVPFHIEFTRTLVFRDCPVDATHHVVE